MKKILICLIAVLSLSLNSCKDYLTIVPSDAIFLEDVQALKQTLGTWLFTYSANYKNTAVGSAFPWSTDLFGDRFTAYSDVWDFNKWSGKETAKWTETEKRYLKRAVVANSEWSNLYEIIGLMNLVLNEIDTAKGDDDMRNYVKGEALMHRAFCFFKLLQYYAPMDDASLGIPVYLDTYGGFDKANLSRMNHKGVFERILADLGEAERLLGITEPRTTYNIMYNYDHVYRIRSYVYLWKACGPVAEDSDWENAASEAKKAIAAAGNVLPMNISELATDKFFGVGSGTCPTSAYPEALYFIPQSGWRFLPNYGYNLEIWKTLYDKNDERKYKWFGIADGRDPELVLESDLLPTRKRPGFSGFAQPGIYFRLSEQYLILIEAYAHTNFEEAKKVLRQWQSVRYKDETEGKWFVPANAEALLEEVYRERKREFLYEADLDWMDMKRLGATDGERNVGGQTGAALTSGDIRYDFMIPESETKTNTKIIQNPGWDEYITLK